MTSLRVDQFVRSVRMGFIQLITKLLAMLAVPKSLTAQAATKSELIMERGATLVCRDTIQTAVASAHPVLT